MTIVNTNVGSLIAKSSLAAQNKNMEASIEKLSTGLRINTASDDAAGMAISSRMESTIRGLSQAIRNSSDGKNMFDTIEGASLEAVNILQRIRELAVQSANDSNTGLDRSFLQKELTQLVAEIDRISSHTTWNGKKLLDGTLSGQQIQIGMFNDEDITFSVDSMASGSIGNYEVDTLNEVDLHASAGAAVITDNTFTIVGSVGSKTVTATAATAKQHAAIANSVTAETGVTATAVTKVKINGLAKQGTHTVNGAYTMALKGTNTTATTITFTIDVASDMRALRDAVNNVSGTTGITAKMGATNADVILTHSTGEDIVITAFDGAGTETSANYHTLAVTALKADETAQDNAGDDAVGAATTTDGSGFQATLKTASDNPYLSTRTHGTVKFQSSEAFSISGYQTDALPSALTNGTLASLASASLSTAVNAEKAIRIVDGALHKINTVRAELGAMSNRMDAAIDNLTNVVTNTQSSQSHIQDVDFAAETSKLTKAQILAQAATSMLAQANTSKQSVLSLLQN
jgi:flagellin